MCIFIVHFSVDDFVGFIFFEESEMEETEVRVRRSLSSPNELIKELKYMGLLSLKQVCKLVYNINRPAHFYYK